LSHFMGAKPQGRIKKSCWHAAKNRATAQR
jgi:hypothetical protein